MNIRRSLGLNGWISILIAAIIGAVLLFSCMGCSSDRAQQAANERARLDAVGMDIGTALTALADLPDVTGRIHVAITAIGLAAENSAHANRAIPAVAEMNSADFPAPSISATTLAATPSVDSVPPEPPTGHAKFWGIVLGGGAAALTIARLAAPYIPVLGPAWKTAIDTAYAVFQHADAKDADKATYQTAAAAQAVLPVMEQLAQVPTTELPAPLQKLLTPSVQLSIFQFLQQAATQPTAKA